jgi:hypothetical protein
MRARGQPCGPGVEAGSRGAAHQEYTDRGQAYYEQRYRQRVVAHLGRRAQQLGMQVVPIAAPA